MRGRRGRMRGKEGRMVRGEGVRCKMGKMSDEYAMYEIGVVNGRYGMAWHGMAWRGVVSL